MMEQIVTATISELKEELFENIDVATEPSRLMRLMHLKYKCFVIFILAFIAALLIVYTIVKEILRDEEMSVLMTQMLQAHYPNVSLS
jgi:hypothetical protein